MGKPQTFNLISDQITQTEMRIIARELTQVLKAGIEGDVTEFGCYEGTAALNEARILQTHTPQKRLWLYDSFEGLPEKTKQDHSPAGSQFVSGALRANKQILLRNFKKAGLPQPIIKKGWFADITAAELPATICFAFLDGDYYESILQSLRLIWPRLTHGAVVIVDDYQNEALPGAARAVDVWLGNHPTSMSVEASLAIIRVS